MNAALALARRGLGNVWPNPAVGCVLVREDLGGQVVGRGWTQPGGRPHAETEAISRAGLLAAGSTAYVTLEPCSHVGKTGPCCEALAQAGINRVVIAIMDPDLRVAGQGIRFLQNAGVKVEVGPQAEAATSLNAGFLSRINKNRPFVSLKVATSLDGKIATSSGKSQWITGPMSRNRGHLARAQHDAILTGINTLESDDSALTCRLSGMEDHSPVRLIADSKLRISMESQVVQSAQTTQTWILTTSLAPENKFKTLEEVGVKVLTCEANTEGQIDLPKALEALSGLGITRLMVEAGATLNGSFFKHNLVDQLLWFRSPMVIGGDGTSAVKNYGVDELIEARRFTKLASSCLEEDILDIYRVL